MALPDTNALKTTVEELLSKVPEFVDESKNLKINVIKDAAENGDVKLLEPLLKNSKTKKVFFSPILDSFVFKTAWFKEILEYSSGCNSYSKYLGKQIGLYMGDSFLLDQGNIVLNFPFKDCVLEGGQRREDGEDAYYEFDEETEKYERKKSNRREVFYNEILAQDEIDSLFSPKAFCNAKRYEINKNKTASATDIENFNRNKDGIISDNLIIKGNNLLALHSLKEQFAGQVKLIYIDPPYNTENDSFCYNDNFSHSSWLTFMKNRLEIAHELLKDDGCIFISLDDKENHYCKVLMDAIFGRDNFIADICHKSRGSISNDKIISSNHSHLLFYAKKQAVVYSRRDDYGITKDLSTFTEKDEHGYYKLVPVDGPGGEKKGNPHFEFMGITNYWRFSKKTMEEMYKKGLLVVKNKSVQQKYYKSKAEKTRQTITTWWDEGYLTSSASTELKKLLWEGAFNNPKNESLLELILEFASKPKDIVLDYHLGSGTTAAVAHKMDRQYIGIEQMDYIQDVTIERLKKVIEGEQTGVSKAQNWQGGGSFVYLELAQKNEKAIELISSCKNISELTKLFDDLCKKYFLHYNVRVKEFSEEIRKDRFKSLPLKEQKEMFCRMLDLNQLYVNIDDRNDKKSGLSKNDLAITEDFYQKKVVNNAV